MLFLDFLSNYFIIVYLKVGVINLLQKLIRKLKTYP